MKKFLIFMLMMVASFGVSQANTNNNIQRQVDTFEIEGGQLNGIWPFRWAGYKKVNISKTGHHKCTGGGVNECERPDRFTGGGNWGFPEIDEQVKKANDEIRNYAMVAVTLGEEPTGEKNKNLIFEDLGIKVFLNVIWESEAGSGLGNVKSTVTYVREQ